MIFGIFLLQPCKINEDAREILRRYNISPIRQTRGGVNLKGYWQLLLSKGKRGVV